MGINPASGHFQWPVPKGFLLTASFPVKALMLRFFGFCSADPFLHRSSGVLLGSPASKWSLERLAKQCARILPKNVLKTVLQVHSLVEN